MSDPIVKADFEAEVTGLQNKLEKYQNLVYQLKIRRSNLLASLVDSSSFAKKIRRITKIEQESERLVKELIPTLLEKLRIKKMS